MDGQGINAITALLDNDGIGPYEKAAAAAMVTAILVESGRAADGIELLKPLIEADDCEPVDHSWLLMLNARCMSELGDLEAARNLAIEVQQLRSLAHTDPTAGALIGSSSGLILASSWTRSEGIPDVMAGRDTLAAWWRSQEIASGLQHQADEDFKEWARDSSIMIGASDQTWLSLRAAALTSGLAGDHSAWRGVHANFARRILITGHGSDEQVAYALDAMRLAGMTTESHWR